jgi:hypothetical protein
MEWRFAGVGSRCESEPCQGDTREARAEFLQGSAARDGLSQVFGEFIEFVIHNFPFVVLC